MIGATKLHAVNAAPLCARRAAEWSSPAANGSFEGWSRCGGLVGEDGEALGGCRREVEGLAVGEPLELGEGGGGELDDGGLGFAVDVGEPVAFPHLHGRP